MQISVKLMEPLNYDAASKPATVDCAYTNPPPIGTVHGPAGIRASVERLDRHLFGSMCVELPVADFYEVHDGSIAYRRDDFDATTILSQSPAA